MYAVTWYLVVFPFLFFSGLLGVHGPLSLLPFGNMSYAFEFAMVATWMKNQTPPGNACWRVLPRLRSIQLPPVERTVWIGDRNDPAYKAFLKENDAFKQVMSMWGAPLTVGYVLVRRGATDKIMLNVHVQLNRRSFQLSATMLSGSQFWQDTFFYSQQIVASQISMYCRTILLSINMVQSTQKLVLIGRNGVIDPRAIIWEGRFHSGSMIYLQSGCRRRLRDKTGLRASFFHEVHLH